MEERLLDLDELVLRCRSEQAKNYISEAVACYRAGAFRSCIVATWVAVVFDIIYKLDELALAGDKNAEKRRIEFDDLRKRSDIANSLRFERQVLDMAKDEFELISPLEYDDLQRLMADRNRCAHPSMNGYDEIYRPTAELARYHLRNTVTHLLQHQPIQGKAALDRLEREVNSLYFPVTAEDALQYFRHGPLARPREALVRNFIILLLKVLLREPLDSSSKKRRAAALNALRVMHRNISENTLAEKSSDTIRSTEDAQFVNVVTFLSLIPDTWQFFTDDVRRKVEGFIDNLDIKASPSTFIWFLDYEPMKGKVVQRVEKLTEDEIVVLIDINPRREYVVPAIKIYSDAKSFNHANKLAKQIVKPLIPFFDVEDVDVIITIVSTNNEVAGSFGLIDILNDIIESRRIPQEKLDEFIIQVGVSDISKLGDMKPLLDFARLEQIIAKVETPWNLPQLLKDLQREGRISEEQYDALYAYTKRRIESSE